MFFFITSAELVRKRNDVFGQKKLRDSSRQMTVYMIVFYVNKNDVTTLRNHISVSHMGSRLCKQELVAVTHTCK